MCKTTFSHLWHLWKKTLYTLPLPWFFFVFPIILKSGVRCKMLPTLIEIDLAFVPQFMCCLLPPSLSPVNLRNMKCPFSSCSMLKDPSDHFGFILNFWTDFSENVFKKVLSFLQLLSECLSLSEGRSICDDTTLIGSNASRMSYFDVSSQIWLGFGPLFL